ncbi:DUF1360 domain-containing protein [Caldibacillus debilis]|jgi:hypothetical protein|uniref:Integral membrane protein n=1 Tax=Caldibacillus debilis GB1 TaxID=1339248 RepID=A0A420VDU7_9BACI|nr:DUF1360 domain-containing protein [Caldibacillus debilis]RKO61513.1 Protein of unknown function (DUF1360) [Caldibacillus debilis GB1]
MIAENGWVLALIGLAAFRVTRLFVYDKIFEFLRAPFFDEVTETGEDGKEETYLVPKKAGWKHVFGELLNCYWCTGVWASLFLTLLYLFWPFWGELIVLVFAVSAVAAIIETVVQTFLGD